MPLSTTLAPRRWHTTLAIGGTMDRNPRLSLSILVLAACAFAPSALAGDWTNSGGNAGRNGLSDEQGPTAPELLWSGGHSSLIAWHPVTEGNQVFMVRQLRWPYQQPHDAYVVAMDLEDGQEAWAVELTYHTGDWTPWVGGVRNGRVYCSRSGNGASVWAHLYCLDAATGDTLWVSDDEQSAGAYDGMVFAENGDPIVGSFMDIWRFDALDGSTVWHAARVGSVSGTCGGALHGDAFYVADAAAGGTILVRYDASSGQRMHQSPLMPGFTIQTTPMVGPDGTVYLARTQNNPTVDFFYAFTDDGTHFVEKWHVPAISGAAGECGVGPDGSVYMMVTGPRLARLDPATGAALDQTAIIAGFSAPRMAIDASGRVYFSNSGFSGGAVFVYEADLSPIWSVPVTNINIGGPSLASGGTLVVCGIGTDVRAYRTVDPAGTEELVAEGMGATRLSFGPNPCHGQASIRFALAEAGPVTLGIYSVDGRLVDLIAVGAPRAAGEHVVTWQAHEAQGAELAAGTYWCRLESRGGSVTQRFLLAR
jgi:outer membrane protein assembly factor BamB